MQIVLGPQSLLLQREIDKNVAPAAEVESAMKQITIEKQRLAFGIQFLDFDYLPFPVSNATPIQHSIRDYMIPTARAEHTCLSTSKGFKSYNVAWSCVAGIHMLRRLQVLGNLNMCDHVVAVGRDCASTLLSFRNKNGKLHFVLIVGGTDPFPLPRRSGCPYRTDSVGGGEGRGESRV